MNDQRQSINSDLECLIDLQLEFESLHEIVSEKRHVAGELKEKKSFLERLGGVFKWPPSKSSLSESTRGRDE